MTDTTPTAEHNPDPRVECGCDECVAYDKHMTEESLSSGMFLPMPIFYRHPSGVEIYVGRCHPANSCDVCKCIPTETNPATTVAGDPPDLENGPSPRDLPFTVCDRCDNEMWTEPETREHPVPFEIINGEWT